LTSTAKIAFGVTFGTGTTGTTYLYTVPTSGGDWTLLSSIYTTNSEYYSNICWSPDDSKIAVILKSMSNGDKILIFNSSTGDLEEEILPPTGVTSINHIDWSRSSENTIAFTGGSSEYIYYVTPPTSGTVPTTNSVSGRFITWSPDNSRIMFYAPAAKRTKAALKTVVPLSSTLSTISTTFTGYYLNWKR
jgi:WD40 repeat protein